MIMIYTGYELIGLFFIYSFCGWCLEVIYTVLEKKKFINRGFLNGIVCPVYGFAMVFMLVFMDSLRDRWFYLFLGCMIIGSVIELLTGLILEKIFQMKLWDYSHMHFNAGGYICLAYSLVWGALGTLIVKLVNPLLMLVIDKLPSFIGMILLSVFLFLLVLDTVTTIAALLDSKKKGRMNEIAEGFTQASSTLRSAITLRIERRMEKAFPHLEKHDTETEEAKEEARLRKTVFAYGCSFYKVFWLFFLGAFLGDITETIFCWATTGRLMSRSSVVYGPFSLVWGIGVAGATILLYKYRNREDRYIFVSGVLLGGAFEYICSVFTEICFGAVFWDYSDIPFNLGGRINLLYCFFWGFAAVIWMKLCYPFFSKWIERLPMKIGKILTWLCLAFMLVNMVVSTGALSRYHERSEGKVPGNEIEEWLDFKFNNERMERIYPNAKMTG